MAFFSIVRRLLILQSRRAADALLQFCDTVFEAFDLTLEAINLIPLLASDITQILERKFRVREPAFQIRQAIVRVLTIGHFISLPFAWLHSMKCCALFNVVWIAQNARLIIE